MLTEATGAVAPAGDAKLTTGLHSPPDSNNAMALDGSDSELSDIEDVAAQLSPEPMQEEEAVAEAASAPAAEAENGPAPAPEDRDEILPDHWSGTVPVFRPTMAQFKDFKRFMEKVDPYGMNSGILKIIPPHEWKDAQPPLDELVKQIRVREPIKQDIMGSNGTYRQVNILHQRSYNLPQWRQLCDQSEHQPPARRGERRVTTEKPKPVRTTRTIALSTGPKPGPTKSRGGRKGRKSTRAPVKQEDLTETIERPMTPESPALIKDEPLESVEMELGEPVDECEEPALRRMGFARQSRPKIQSTSARRKYVRREGSAAVDEEAFKDWDYTMDISDYTAERCEELEKTYWKTLTYAPPLYGADLLGTLFDDRTEIWNLNKLPNLLDVLGSKIPGVNTAYLYLGMWKATFAWHLEDVDLYSINYLHFGAPKQWYSISQRDARKFEAAMKNIWPTEAKACDQFLRHKAFLISPSHLKQHYGITVNKCLSYPGEFVVTYPYGYHSGYNLGYNCAEAVNFALDSWLPMGKIAKRCQCAQAQDSVWIDVYDVEHKLHGEEIDCETEDEEEDDDEADEEAVASAPKSRHTIKTKPVSRKRKRAVDKREVRVKTRKIRLRTKPFVEPPCCLCPNDIPCQELVPTEDGRKAHRICALYIPETYTETVDDKEVVANVDGISKARLDLKCLYCRSKKGACFQCSQKKCPKSYHATCAAAAGVFVEDEEVPVLGEDGTEYKEQAFEFSCRFHRTKRNKKLDGAALEDDERTRRAAGRLKKGVICQLQYFKGDIFAGVVVENCYSDESFVLDIIPNGDRVLVEWKWLLLPDPADYRLPKASAKALPMPTSNKAKQELNATRPINELPRKDDLFVDGFTWAEFHAGDTVRNLAQIKVDFSKENQIWHYLGETSTEAKPQYTEQVDMRTHNPASNFLDTIPRPAAVSVLRQAKAKAAKAETPYSYQPRTPAYTFTTQQFVPALAPSVPSLSLAREPVHSQTQLQQKKPKLPRQQKEQPYRDRPEPPQSCADKMTHPFGTDPNFHGSGALFTSDRFAPVGGSNGFPQLPGLTWPPAHMKSGQNSQPSTRVWARPAATATTEYKPHIVPMVSSALKTPQAPIRAYQRYSYFQVNHNREPSRYRTPYAPFVGFTNNYEGNLRAFLVKAQNNLLQEREATRNLSIARLVGPPVNSTERASSSMSHGSASIGIMLNPTTPSSNQTALSTSPITPLTARNDVRRLHPAIRRQYTSRGQEVGTSTVRSGFMDSKESTWLAQLSMTAPSLATPTSSEASASRLPPSGPDATAPVAPHSWSLHPLHLTLSQSPQQPFPATQAERDHGSPEIGKEKLATPKHTSPRQSRVQYNPLNATAVPLSRSSPAIETRALPDSHRQWGRPGWRDNELPWKQGDWQQLHCHHMPLAPPIEPVHRWDAMRQEWMSPSPTLDGLSEETAQARLQSIVRNLRRLSQSAV